MTIKLRFPLDIITICQIEIRDVSMWLDKWNIIFEMLIITHLLNCSLIWPHNTDGTKAFVKPNKPVVLLYFRIFIQNYFG